MTRLLWDRAVGLTSAAGALALVGTLAGFAADRHWLLDLCSHCRAQAALGLLLSAVVTGLARRRITAAAHVIRCQARSSSLAERAWLRITAQRRKSGRNARSRRRARGTRGSGP